MSLRADARIGLTMLAWRSALRFQAGLGDPVAKMLVKGPNTPPYPIYDRIRALGDLPRSRMGVHVTASHEVVNSILRDGRFGVQTALPVDGPVILLLAGASRDPAVFEHPERFDPTRPNNRDHLAFSAGIHYLLGAGLARIEAAAALRALFERYPDLRVAGPVIRRRSRNINGVRRLPVRGTAAPVRVS